MSVDPIETLTVDRVAPGSYVSGLWVNGAASDFTIDGSVQPFQFRSRQLLPEGMRTFAKYKFFADSPDQPKLISVDIGDFQNGDTVTRSDGNSYKVFEVADWSHDVDGCPHVEYALLEVGDDEK